MTTALALAVVVASTLVTVILAWRLHRRAITAESALAATLAALSAVVGRRAVPGAGMAQRSARDSHRHPATSRETP